MKPLQLCPDPPDGCMLLRGDGVCEQSKVRPFRCISESTQTRVSDGKAFHYVMWQTGGEELPELAQLVADDGEVALVKPGWGNRPNEWRMP